MSERGPDSSSQELIDVGSGTLFLGHNRLSIIDLSDAAVQPMTTMEGQFTIAYNGEVYNYIELRRDLEALGHQFSSSSDTEVVLHAWQEWGAGCIPRFVGMFAFAILDRREGTLTCVRDAFGIKPLFFMVSPGRILFASDLRALAVLREEQPSPNWQRCFDYLVQGDFDSDASTFIEGVHQIRPAHWISFDLNSGAASSQVRWWTPSVENTARLTLAEAAEAVREQFLENVRLHTRSDVPIGAALSGGVDSSALVCAMRYLEPDSEIKTFSFVAPGHPLSEERWIDRVNDHVGAIPHKISLGHTDLATDLDDLVDIQGEPFGTPSVYGQYRVFGLAKQSGVTVTLDGQGADELFAGYSGYPGYRLLSLLETGHPVEAFRFARAWSDSPGRTSRQPWRQLRASLQTEARNCLSESAYWRDPPWVNSDFVSSSTIRRWHPGLSFPEGPRGRRVVGAQKAALTRVSIPHLLRQADRASMRFSVESRVPFLTKSLADLAFSLPESYLISEDGHTKTVLREAMRGIVPPEVLFRRDKIGFGTPNKDWLISGAPTWRRWLLDAPAIPLLNRKQLLLSFDATVAGRVPFTWHPFTWIIFSRWFDRMGFSV